MRTVTQQGSSWASAETGGRLRPLTPADSHSRLSQPESECRTAHAATDYIETTVLTLTLDTPCACPHSFCMLPLSEYPFSENCRNHRWHGTHKFPCSPTLARTHAPALNKTLLHSSTLALPYPDLFSLSYTHPPSLPFTQTLWRFRPALFHTCPHSPMLCHTLTLTQGQRGFRTSPLPFMLCPFPHSLMPPRETRYVRLLNVLVVILYLNSQFHRPFRRRLFVRLWGVI